MKNEDMVGKFSDMAMIVRGFITSAETEEELQVLGNSTRDILNGAIQETAAKMRIAKLYGAKEEPRKAVKPKKVPSKQAQSLPNQQR